jgi:hypothetical protein
MPATITGRRLRLRSAAAASMDCLRAPVGSPAAATFGTGPDTSTFISCTFVGRSRAARAPRLAAATASARVWRAVAALAAVKQVRPAAPSTAWALKPL